MVAESAATGAATLTFIATAYPAFGPPLMVYSAATTLLLPVVVSLPVPLRATLTAPLLGLGVSVRPEVIGPALSRFKKPR